MSCPGIKSLSECEVVVPDVVVVGECGGGHFGTVLGPVYSGGEGEF